MCTSRVCPIRWHLSWAYSEHIDKLSSSTHDEGVILLPDEHTILTSKGGFTKELPALSAARANCDSILSLIRVRWTRSPCLLFGTHDLLYMGAGELR